MWADIDAPAARGRIPFPAWPNVLSLDAVFVAVVWQQLLMRVFCGRSTRWPEGVALSLTVWLIYVADRLLDGAKLDMQQPHTLRHRFYRRHCRVFLPLWVVGLLLNTLVVVCWLPTELMRNGLFLASAVLMYGASVHFSSKRSRREGVTAAGSQCEAPAGAPRWLAVNVPKEVRVGVLFALGISLTTWTQLFSDVRHASIHMAAIGMAIWPLLATTCGLAFLFSWNCILVARFDCEYDRAQAFASIATRPGWGELGGSRLTAQACLAAAALGLTPLVWLLNGLPPPIEIAGLASAVGLLVSVFLPGDCFHRLSNAAVADGSPATFDVRSAWVDAVLWTPPLVLLCWL